VCQESEVPRMAGLGATLPKDVGLLSDSLLPFGKPKRRALAPCYVLWLDSTIDDLFVRDEGDDMIHRLVAATER
jgi:hypothetical protein